MQNIRAQSVVEVLGQRAIRHPHRTALLYGEQRVTFGELWSRVVTAACYLSDCGVHPGERVVLAAPSVPAFAYGYFATHLLGAVAVPMDPHAPAPRRDELIQRTQPVLAFSIGGSAHSTTPCSWKAIEAIDELRPQERDFSPPALDSLADLIFTTGTTGRPKGVQLTHRNIATAVSHINAVIGTAEGDVNLIPIPLYHAFGLGSLRCFLAAGATVVLVRGFRLPGEIFGAIERHDVTGMIGVPAGFAVLLRLGERGLGAYAERLRYIEIGSAPMPMEQKQFLMHLLPRTKLFMHYGLTEAGRSAFIEFHRNSAHLDTVGLPSPGVKVEIRDDRGKECGTGVQGMLWISGNHISPGYWDDAELNSTTFINGWVRTGDIAHLDAAGFIHLHGRDDDVINTGGVKVMPDEVERVLAEHPAVAEAACVGMPDPRGIAGQVLRALLVATEGQPFASDAELSRWVAQRLEQYMVPAKYEWVPALPRTASGKLVRARLRIPVPPKL